MVARHVIVHGRVQGVSFRASCGEVARDAGVTGWVQNRPDGTVEAHLQGERDAVERVVAWCHDGPPHAEVTRVDVDETAPTGVDGFDVR